MEKPGIHSHPQNVEPKKENAANKLKGMFDRFSKSNPFGGGFSLQRQTAGCTPRTGSVRKSTPRSGKKLR